MHSRYPARERTSPDRPAIIWSPKDGGGRPPQHQRFERTFPRHSTVLLDELQRQAWSTAGAPRGPVILRHSPNRALSSSAVRTCV